MKARYILLSFLALVALAKEPRWYMQRGTPVTVESSGFELRAMMPQGWSYQENHGFVPPPELASSCRVRGVLHTDREWDRFLASALRDRYDDERHVLKIGGHPAVSNRYTRDDRTIRNIYIDLSEVQRDSGAVWSFEGSPTPEGRDCEQQFVAMIHSVKVTERRRPAG